MRDECNLVVRALAQATHAVVTCYYVAGLMRPISDCDRYIDLRPLDAMLFTMSAFVAVVCAIPTFSGLWILGVVPVSVEVFIAIVVVLLALPPAITYGLCECALLKGRSTP